MTEKTAKYGIPLVEPRILTMRGQRVILDADLATIYGVETKTLNRAVRRNIVRFPDDFSFQLTQRESAALRCQFGTTNSVRGGSRYRPRVFTEHGAIMAASILNSPRAVQMSVFVVRAFVKMRALISAHGELATKLAALEEALTKRLDLHERVISDIVRQISLLLESPEGKEPPRERIGFHVRDPGARYRRKIGLRYRRKIGQ